MTNRIIIVLLWCFHTVAFGQKPLKNTFQVVPLGVKGGIDESNLSAYMLAPLQSSAYICLDAGTIYAGINQAITQKTFTTNPSEVLRKYIKGYLISHAHLDHVSGLIITSPADSSKPIYATDACMKMMQDHYFNGITWANFGDEGKGFLLKKYHFQTLNLAQEIKLDNTDMWVTTMPLSHVNPFESSAFLVRKDDNYVLYLGDTGADEVEKSNKLNGLWQKIAPLVISKQLKGVFIEVSFPNEQPDKSLFGHLTPNWLMKELTILSELTGKNALKGFKVVITHQKPPIKSEMTIKKQLIEQNTLGLTLIFPTQGKRFEL
jgi:cAMP phosphodiesterase